MRLRNVTNLDIHRVRRFGLLAWASVPAAAAVRIEGQVQPGGGPVAQSAVALWAGSANAPVRLRQATTGADGRFVVSTDRTPGGDSSLHLVIDHQDRVWVDNAIGDKVARFPATIQASRLVKNLPTGRRSSGVF